MSVISECSLSTKFVITKIHCIFNKTNFYHFLGYVADVVVTSNGKYFVTAESEQILIWFPIHPLSKKLDSFSNVNKYFAVVKLNIFLVLSIGICHTELSFTKMRKSTLFRFTFLWDFHK